MSERQRANPFRRGAVAHLLGTQDLQPSQHTATDRFERIAVRVVTAARAMAGVQMLVGTASVRRSVRHRLPLSAAAVAITAESIWAAARTLRRQTAVDRLVAMADGLAADLALVGEATSWGARQMPPDPRWSPVYGLLTAAWTGFGHADATDGAAAMASWIATYAMVTADTALDRGGVSVRGQRYAEMAAGAVFTSVGGNLGRGMRAMARDLDEARAHAIDDAERQAAERERAAQHRVIHDSALQVLETVGGSWDVDTDLVLHRIRFEIARLTRVLAGGGLAPEGGLGDLMAALRTEFSYVGLDVTLHLADAPLHCPRPALEVLNDAAHEALVNVHKHAGTRHADVRVRSSPNAVVVEISDQGPGFDVSAPRTGFGVTESIERRLHDVGGIAVITSVVGAGTTVTLTMAQ